MPAINTHKICELALTVIDLEAKAVANLAKKINHDFVAACSIMQQCKGKVIVIGMGKSGHIAGKIAATLASTGTPAFFVHAAEASHGDLGMMSVQDVILAISNSGETSELLTLLPLIKRLNIPLIAMTGAKNSTLAKFASVHLDVSVTQEACPLGLAPTSSSTVALVMGDALALAILDSNGFTQNDFALSHPGGNLGKRLLLQVDDLMHTGTDIPIVNPENFISQVLLEMTAKKLGMTAVINHAHQVMGVFTDGDLRRMLAKNLDVHSTTVEQVMTAPCTMIKANLLAAEAMQIMESKEINALLIVDTEQKLLGALNMHDLIHAGIV